MGLKLRQARLALATREAQVRERRGAVKRPGEAAREAAVSVKAVGRLISSGC